MVNETVTGAHKREALVRAVAQHLVQEGFSNSGIRALAQSAGISDRMLMYYFDTKDELITEALLVLAADMSASLERLLPARPVSARRIVAALTEAASSEAQQPALRFWFEIVGLAVRGTEPYQSTARQIVADWESWIRLRLRPDQQSRARQLLAEVEGRIMLDLLAG